MIHETLDSQKMIHENLFYKYAKIKQWWKVANDVMVKLTGISQVSSRDINHVVQFNDAFAGKTTRHNDVPVSLTKMR